MKLSRERYSMEILKDEEKNLGSRYIPHGVLIAKPFLVIILRSLIFSFFLSLRFVFQSHLTI